ncbi:MAG: tripartite tricarboxylate transporter substrate binding protein [Proteobacteria bacterium]|nr:tripartite tricarboxylate transporter substrate binding protein [Pseudomonadota bacterium]
MRIIGIATMLAMLALMPAQAQTPTNFPSRTITIVVAYSPGGGTDTAARMVAKDLAVELGQTVIVENRPGAGGAIGAELVARAKPDGYTLLFGSGSELDVLPAVRSKAPYDTLKDFTPITQVGSVAFLLVANPSLKVNSVQELIKLAQTKEVTYASFGVGSTNNLIGEAFAHKTGAKLVHVPYKGSAAAATDLLSGQVQIAFDTVGSVLPHVEAGKLKALATLSPTRSSFAPNIPTMAESGVSNFIFEGSLGVLAPRNTPPQIVQRLHNAIAKVLKSPTVIGALNKRGVTVVGSDPNAFGAFLKADVEKWKAIAHAAKIEIQ